MRCCSLRTTGLCSYPSTASTTRRASGSTRPGLHVSRRGGEVNFCQLSMVPYTIAGVVFFLCTCAELGRLGVALITVKCAILCVPWLRGYGYSRVSGLHGALAFFYRRPASKVGQPRKCAILEQVYRNIMLPCCPSPPPTDHISHRIIAARAHGYWNGRARSNVSALADNALCLDFFTPYGLPQVVRPLRLRVPSRLRLRYQFRRTLFATRGWRCRIRCRGLGTKCGGSGGSVGSGRGTRAGGDETCF